MIDLTKIEKKQKLFFIGAFGIEECEVYIPRVYMSTPIMYQTEPKAYFYAALEAVVRLPDGFVKIISVRESKHFFYTYQEAEIALRRIFDKMNFELDKKQVQ